jgi:hypothetical protein
MIFELKSRRCSGLAPLLLAAMSACAGGGGDEAGPAMNGTAGSSGNGSMAGASSAAGRTGSAGMPMAGAGRSGAAGSAGTLATAGTGAAGTTSVTGGAGAGGAAGTGMGGASGGGSAGTTPFDPSAGPPDIPMPTSTCPEFRSGNVMFSVMGAQRRVVISMSSAAESMSGGALIFYWHATGGAPSEAQRGLPVSDVTGEGGIVVAPVDVSNAGAFPWLSQFPEHDALFDEVLACAVQKTKIDVKRIHSLGWSAGGIMTTHLSYSRSKYMASVATYSGGGGGMFQEANNKFAAMIMAGGPGDQLVLNFYTGSMDWQAVLKQAGHFAMFCDHGGGHSIPTRRVPDVWQFFKDHPYGTNPSPYAGHIPASIASLCTE